MKSAFTTNLDTRAVDGGYKLLAPLKYYSEILDDVVIVPEHFFTDFASIPRIGRIFISGHGRDRWAATVHDYLYSQGLERKLADKVFLEAMEVMKVSLIKRRIMYRAVRTGGWMFYEKD